MDPLHPHGAGSLREQSRREVMRAPLQEACWRFSPSGKKGSSGGWDCSGFGGEVCSGLGNLRESPGCVCGGGGAMS